MKKSPRILVIFLLATLCCVVLAESALALSDADYKKMLKASPEFMEADKRLNAAWGALRKAASDGQMERYRESQRHWANVERDGLIDSMSDEGYRDMIPKSALKDGEVDRALAYALVTNERAALLEELAKQERDGDYLAAFHGILESARDDIGELYWFTPDGWWTSLVFCYSNSEISAAADAREILDKSGEPCYVTVSGRLNGGDGFDWKENGRTLSIESD
jgi:uncharacterized protein YecT (DUF1311 family)